MGRRGTLPVNETAIIHVIPGHKSQYLGLGWFADANSSERLEYDINPSQVWLLGTAGCPNAIPLLINIGPMIPLESHQSASIIEDLSRTDLPSQDTATNKGQRNVQPNKHAGSNEGRSPFDKPAPAFKRQCGLGAGNQIEPSKWVPIL